MPSSPRRDRVVRVRAPQPRGPGAVDRRPASNFKTRPVRNSPSSKNRTNKHRSHSNL